MELAEREGLLGTKHGASRHAYLTGVIPLHRCSDPGAISKRQITRADQLLAEREGFESPWEIEVWVEDGKRDMENVLRILRMSASSTRNPQFARILPFFCRKDCPSCPQQLKDK
jgi:hypothetical protein